MTWQVTTSSFEPEAQQVLLLLVDISGYTRFMVTHGRELRHSQTIVGELLESLMQQIEVPLRIAQTEGDALFLYAIKSGDLEVWTRRSKTLLQRLLDLFRVFKERLLEIGSYSVCRCDACVEVGDLKLKIIAHSGEALFSQVGQFPTLSGVDVITLHRLAKNTVTDDEYVLLTESAYLDLGVPGDVVVREGAEVLDTGVFRTFTYVPNVAVELDPDTIRSRFSDDNAAVRILRDEVSSEYSEVAVEPDRGFHFNVGRTALLMNEYESEWLDGIPEAALQSFSGMGNPFLMGMPREGEYVVDIGSGAGVDSQIAAVAVGAAGHVIGVEMTKTMLEKANAARDERVLSQLEFREGYAENLPVADAWADLVISNGVVNLSPAKDRVFREIFRVLRPGGRIQIADITVQREIPEGAKRDIDLWTS